MTENELVYVVDFPEHLDDEALEEIRELLTSVQNQAYDDAYKLMVDERIVDSYRLVGKVCGQLAACNTLIRRLRDLFTECMEDGDGYAERVLQLNEMAAASDSILNQLQLLFYNAVDISLFINESGRIATIAAAAKRIDSKRNEVTEETSDS